MELDTLELKPGAHVFCKGWGGEKNRERLTSKEALMMLDVATRTIEIAPLGRGDGMTIPLENARQWTVKQQPKRTGTRTGAAISAKAPA